MVTALVLSLLAAAPQSPHDPVLATQDGRTKCTTLSNHVPAGKTGSGPSVICRADRSVPETQAAREEDKRQAEQAQADRPAGV